MDRTPFVPASQTFYCHAVAFHFSKVKGSMELVESIHSLLFKSKGKVSPLQHPIAIPSSNLGQRQSLRSPHHGMGYINSEWSTEAMQYCACGPIAIFFVLVDAAVNKEAGHHGVLRLCI